jgi:hypothetical protein
MHRPKSVSSTLEHGVVDMLGACNAYTDKFFHLNYILFLLKY